MKLRKVFVTCLSLLLGLPSPLWALHPLDEPVVRAIRMTLPSVVGVRSRKAGGFLGLGKVEPSGQGVGIVVSRRGYILTCAHLVQTATPKVPPLVLLRNGQQLPAELVAVDPDWDLALLRARLPKELPLFSLDRISPNVLGQTVLVIGGSLGVRQTVSRGILSSNVQRIRLSGQRPFYFVQLDAAVNPGNSGAPVVDLEGRLVGICLAKVGGQAVEHVGLAIPGVLVRHWVTQLLEHSDRAWPSSVPVNSLRSRKCHRTSLSPKGLPSPRSRRA
ncbi:S1C family serine protease [Candidatus Methylacidithermus pantelleriae]|uniref:Uncharacterized protein n=1 Tax=Candidatus Methylacidithermus pantelleriae TaxID=2744239 RepID=A0A8J2FSC5_9BACT|nr:S1C family serine protease [Candidatus Methylacidithermus pantelleriae]CAF0697835.1 exported hypothetical protein [Candidatus Methylacidithermus pantelleriae]